MEDLLASIRKAIHEDIGDVPASVGSLSQGTVFRGTMRELRVKVGDEVSAAAAEIQELRDKINRTRASEARTRDLSSPPVRSPGFAGILSGEAERARPRRLAESPPPQTLRPSFAEAEVRTNEPIHREPLRRFSREAETVTPAIATWREEPQSLPQPVETRYQPDPVILSVEASEAAGAAFNRLADTLLSRATGERSIEDMTRELLRGMLKQWLDDNLPGLVERLVREEIERVARRGR